MRPSLQRDASPADPASETLDRVLEHVEHTELSVTELRVLLALLERRDATIAELAQGLDASSTEITRAARPLAMRGLIRWRQGGRPQRALLGVTVAGTATIEALLRTLGSPGPRQAPTQRPAGRDEPAPHGSRSHVSRRPCDC